LIDLPIAPTSPSAAAAAGARPAANSPQRDAGMQDDESAFHALLAQELGLVPGGQAPLSLAARAAAATAGAGLEPGDDAAQTPAASDASLVPANAALIPFPPALAGAAAAPPAGAAVSSFAAGLAPASGARLDARPQRLAQASETAPAQSPLPTIAAAADFAASGKFPPTTAGEIRPEIAFDASLPEPRKDAPPAAAAASIDAAAPVQLTHAAAALSARVGEHGWGQSLGDRLVWMAGQSQQVAQLHLNPPELGPLQITLTLDRDQASAQFVSAHALVRDAIEAAMPRLREMLADSGIALGNASVSADAFREQAQAQPQHEPHAYAAAAGVAMADAATGSTGTQLLRLSRGLVDTFA